MIKTIAILILISFQVLANSDDLILKRKQMIVDVFNSKADMLYEKIELSDIELNQADGRVALNKKAKFSYYIAVEDFTDINSKLTLIPMATSRFTPTYYQTDDWWDKHKTEIDEAKKNGTPQPKQDLNEVAGWLEDMKLSTNPDVLIIDPLLKKTVRQPLQDYLLNVYIEKYTVNGKVILYRGAERLDEKKSWDNGQIPKGARYWTPTANYAWRYGRKNKDFFDLAAKNETPLFKFEVPVEDFKQMVNKKWRELTLGTELTKNAHQIFDRSSYFGDHLYNSLPYLGVGHLGLEFEIRSNRSGSLNMTKYYKGSVTLSELAAERINIIQLTMNRLKIQDPEKFKSQYETEFKKRLAALKDEKEIFLALESNQPIENAEALLDKANKISNEISYIDGFDFVSWAKKEITFKTINKCSGLFNAL